MRKCHIEAGNGIKAYFALQMTPRFLHNLQTGMLVHFRHQIAKKKRYVSSFKVWKQHCCGHRVQTATNEQL